MVEEIGKILTSRRQTLAVAESCTGGKLSGRFVTFSGVSSYYLGAVVSYSNSLKENILGVPQPLIKTVGAVSAPVVVEMARGVRDLTDADWSIAITGIAGPSGGTPDKPVGTVWFAVVGPGVERTICKLLKGDRNQIQEDAVNVAIELLNQTLRGEK